MSSRRRFLATSLAALAASACGLGQVRPAPATPGPPTSRDLDAWTTQVQAMLSDALQTLRTFDGFAAFRISTTPTSGVRSKSELVWDAPTGKDWDDATHVARGLSGRAEQLFQAVTTAQVSSTIWREQREMADVIRDIASVGDALTTYRDRIDRLPPGDASGTLNLLDRAWDQWDTTAARVDMARAEPIACG